MTQKLPGMYHLLCVCLGLPIQAYTCTHRADAIPACVRHQHNMPLVVYPDRQDKKTALANSCPGDNLWCTCAHTFATQLQICVL